MKTLLAISVAIILMGGSIFAQSTGAATASSEAKAAKKPTFRSTKDQVKQAQGILKEKKLFTGEATGTSSAEWKAAVKEYQASNGLSKTGSLNRATLEKMGIELTEKQTTIPVNPAHIASSDPARSTAKTRTRKSSSSSDTAKLTDGPKRPAPFRASDDQIKMAQKMLRDGKMLAGGEDGKLDDATRDALGKYQQGNSLKVTKTLNSMTLEKMGIALTEKQKQQVAAQSAFDAAKAPKN